MRKILSILVAMVMIISMASCGHQHKVGEWVLDKSPTCTEDGAKHKACLECGEIVETGIVQAKGHVPNKRLIIDVEPTCTEYGEGHYTCSVCNGIASIESIDPLGHKLGKTIIDSKATCTKEGKQHGVCTVCGEKIETTIPMVAHSYSNHVCRVCGQKEPLEMTENEISLAKSIKNSSDVSFEQDYGDECYRFFFSLMDSSKNRIAVPVAVDLIIKNSSNEAVFKESYRLSSNDFENWSTTNGTKLLAAIKIDDWEIDESESSKGYIYYKIYNDYVSLDQQKLNITNLPSYNSSSSYSSSSSNSNSSSYSSSLGLGTMSATLKLPTLPIEITQSSSLYTTKIKVTSITYEKSYSNFKIIVAAEKTYDSEGSNSDNFATAYFNIYDSDGYKVKYSLMYIDDEVGTKEKHSFNFYPDNKSGTYYLKVEEN